MFKISLSYSFSEQRSHALLSSELIDTLSAIESQGSIAAAAKFLGISYRHLWGRIKRWEETLGHPLVHGSRGRDTRLTDLAQKMLWAERQVIARNEMELVKVRTDLERVFALAMASDAQIVTLSGCPDESLITLRDTLAAQNVILDINFNSSRKGLEDLAAERSLIAGFNAPMWATAQSNAGATFSEFFASSEVSLFRYCARTQGLAVAKGNPLGLCSLIDVVRKDARFINRERGTGTRVLLEDLLTHSGLSARQLRGYDHEEASHLAVAQAVAQGSADAGLCIESAAKKAGIDFIPFIVENYYLAVLRKNLSHPGLPQLLETLRSETWREQIRTLPGYVADNAGQPVSHTEVAWLDAK
ncbi:MAG: helix-turn-helix transcriptional regulator [Duodenibacillus sp.]|nr:helix-turn-helix transcriptional regulator [Duodenibacillus sp.]